MEDIFSRTMQACLENKKTAVVNSKKVFEKTTVAKKPVAKKALTEKKVVAPKKATKKTVEQRKFMEESDFDSEMAELDSFEATAEDPNEVPDDIADNIVVVVDPELDETEMSETAQDAQDIIDNTEEGEVPTTDEYIDDFTYTCPICGNTFFSATALSAGDACPVCGDTPDNFVLVGQVAEFGDDEEVVEDEVEVDETDETDETVEDEVDVEEDDFETDTEVEADEEEAEVASEKFSRRIVAPRRAEAARRIRKTAENKSVRRPIRKAENKIAPRRIVKRSMNLDENTFNPFLTKFVRENYSNVRSLKVTSAKLHRNQLTLECKLAYVSGRTKNVTLKGEGFVRNGKCILNVRDDGTFKVTESANRKAPILLRVNTSNGVVRCEGMKYDFKTVSEGRKYRVASKSIVESAKRVPARKPVARRTVR